MYRKAQEPFPLGTEAGQDALGSELSPHVKYRHPGIWGHRSAARQGERQWKGQKGVECVLCVVGDGIRGEGKEKKRGRWLRAYEFEKEQSSWGENSRAFFLPSYMQTVTSG